MARTIRDSNLETRTARGRLKPNGQPYYRGLEPGLHLGYRKPREGAGKWLARLNVDGTYGYRPLGTADDFSDPDGKVILSYKQAQDAARKVQVNRGVGTVSDAMEAYLRALAAEGRPPAAIADLRGTINALILPTLGHIELAKLTTSQLERWRNDLARRPARMRTPSGEPQRYRVRDDDADAARARRASTNRVRAVLVSGLNHAFHAGHVASDLAWRRLKAFRGVNKARLRYLSVAEAKRLINGADPEFKPLLQAALATGARYGSLTRLVVTDFDSDAGTLRLRTRKGGGSERTYHVHLTDEARDFFRAACAGRRGGDLIFTRDDGRPWEKSQQHALMRRASERAGITPPISFHTCRHTFASLSTMGGAPLLVVAQALGHTTTRQIEQTYGHLAPSYAADAIRKAAPTYGIKPSNVRPLHGKG